MSVLNSEIMQWPNNSCCCVTRLTVTQWAYFSLPFFHISCWSFEFLIAFLLRRKIYQQTEYWKTGIEWIFKSRNSLFTRLLRRRSRTRSQLSQCKKGNQMADEWLGHSMNLHSTRTHPFMKYSFLKNRKLISSFNNHNHKIFWDTLLDSSLFSPANKKMAFWMPVCTCVSGSSWVRLTTMITQQRWSLLNWLTWWWVADCCCCSLNSEDSL